MKKVYYFYKLYVLISSLILLSLNSFAQGQQIRGKVTSSKDGTPIPGINVLKKNSTVGTAANTLGEYQLVADSRDVLIFSGIGYIAKEITVGERSLLDVELDEDTRQLGELVVVGYGTQKKRDITGSVASIGSKDFNRGFQNSVDQLIAGRAPGVQVTQASSEPGGGVTIRIRGANSINANNEPLYVIDGLPIDNSPVTPGSPVVNETARRNPLNALNPNDIESVEILKDASATAIYGSRGANGVILVTTKKGASGKLRIDYNVSGGTQQVAKTIDMLNAEQYIGLLNDLRADLGEAPEFTPDQISAIGQGTDWQSEIYKTAYVQNHQLGFSGGKDQFNYYASLNYADQDGVIQGSGHKRYIGRANLSYNSHKFKFGLNLNSSYVRDDYKPSGVSINESAGIINTAIYQDPTLPVYNPDGSYHITRIVNLENPVSLIHEIYDVAGTNRTFGNAFAEYFILPEWSVKVNIGSDRQSARRDAYISRQTKRGEGTRGIASVRASEAANSLMELTSRYSKQMGQNPLEVLIGYTFQSFDQRSLNTGAQNFPLDALLTNNLSAGAQNTFTLGSGRSRNQLQSFLGRLHYSIRDKYLITASFRADGSSRFGENNKYGFFPSAAIGWRLSDEKFLNQIDELSELKLRASYGLTGNQEIGSYNSLVLLGPQGQAVLGGSAQVGIAPTQLPNPDLKWETTSQFNIGADFGLWNNRINGTVDYFYKTTRDLLLALPIPRTTGFSTTLRNVGSLKNTGFELGINTVNLTGKIGWKSSINLSTARNEVTDLGGLPFILSGSAGFTNDFTIITKGQPLNAFFGYLVDGVFQLNDNITDSPQPLSRPGEYRYADINGDGVINASDRTILGSPFPDFTYGFGNEFTYGNLSLNFFIQGVKGSTIFNINRTESENPISFRRNRLAETYTDRWTPENPTNKNSSAIPVAVSYASNINSRAAEDASYVRLKNVQISYNVPLGGAGAVKNLQLYATGQNLLTITKYSGADPEASAFGISNVRADYNAYPLTRIYTLGANIGF